MSTDLIAFSADTHEYFKNGELVLSVTQVLAKAGICDFSFVDEDVRVHSMNRGQSVHWMLQLEDEGALNYRTVPKGLRGYRKAYRTWKRQSGFNVLWVEKQFVSPFGFAGTIDRAGSFPATTMYLSGTSAVLDFKTGPIADWTALQLCAYSLAIDPRPSIARNIRRIGLQLKPDGTYRVREFPLCTWDSDMARFMAALKKVA
jgi:hypothetical protein